MRSTRWMVGLALVGLLAAGVWAAVASVIRDDAGDTAYQTSSGEGNPIELTADAYGRQWVNVAGTNGNERGTALTTVTKATWTALSTIGNGRHRYLQIVLTDNTASETAVLHIWGSSDGGTTWYPMVRADTLADAKDVTLAVGTYRPAAAGNYAASVVVAVGPATHVYITEKTAPAAGTYSYKVGGL